jgi:hypothetical protein
MTDPIPPKDLALLHHLQAAADDVQLPKHVARELEQQGLVELSGASPGEVALTAAGQHRLEQLAAAQAGTDPRAG